MNYEVLPRIELNRETPDPTRWRELACATFRSFTALPDFSVLSGTLTPVSAVECIQNRSLHSIYRSSWTVDGKIGEHYFIYRKENDGSVCVYDCSLYSQLETYVFDDELLEKFDFTPSCDVVLKEVMEAPRKGKFTIGATDYEFVGTDQAGHRYEFYANDKIRLTLTKEHEGNWIVTEKSVQISPDTRAILGAYIEKYFSKYEVQ